MHTTIHFTAEQCSAQETLLVEHVPVQA